MNRLGLAFALLTLSAGVAKADIIQANPFFLDLGAEGFGAAPRLLTLQTSPLEVGSTVAAAGGATTLTGDAVPGADKSFVYNVGALQWTTGANVGIGLNTDQTGASQGLAVNAIDLTLYTSAGTAIQTFSLGTPFTLTAAQLAEQQGNGNAVFNFALDAAQQAQFNADLAANGGASNVFEGLGSSLGCSSGDIACEANDGPDSFLAFNQSAVPEVSTWLMMILGFAGVGLVAHRRRGFRFA